MRDGVIGISDGKLGPVYTTAGELGLGIGGMINELTRRRKPVVERCRFAEETHSMEPRGG